MERRELYAAPSRASVADGYYRVEGRPRTRPTPTDPLFLRPAPDGVRETGAYERGTYEVIAWHPSEQAACGHLFHVLG
ncbi:MULTISPECIES: hypothetical protein [unclassified Streptomyces]|uniref:hypothetical protein n=1 Tax=unclassified Streptomyces TaxID=2593676 RepID=UPI0037F6C9D6